MNRKEIGILAAIIITLIISRLIPHAPNFTSSLAGLIFAGFALRKTTLAIIILAGYYLTDLFINNVYYSGNSANFQWTSQAFLWIYVSLMISFLLSCFLSSRLESPFGLLGISVISSLVFFLLSNFGVWTENFLYPLTFSGLAACYLAALPFLLNELAASVFFVTMFYFVYWKIRAGDSKLKLAS